MVNRICSPLGAVVMAWAFTDFIRAACLLIYGELHPTTLHLLVTAIGYKWAALICVVSAICAAYAILSPRRTMFGLLSILFQQFLLLFFTVGPITAILISKYADGVIRNRGFILVDQLPHVTPVVVHIAAVVGYWLPSWGSRERSITRDDN